MRVRAKSFNLSLWIAGGALCAALLACSGMSGAPGGVPAGGAVGEGPGGAIVSGGGSGGGGGAAGGGSGSAPGPITLSGPLSAASGGIMPAPADDEKLGDDCEKGVAKTHRMYRLFRVSPTKMAEDETIMMSPETANFEQGYLLQQGEAIVHCIAEAWDISRYTWSEAPAGVYVRAVVDHITVIPPPPEPDTGGPKIVKDPVKQPSHRYQDLQTTEKNSSGTNLAVSLPVEDMDTVSFYSYGASPPPSVSPTLSAAIDGAYAPDAAGEPMLTLKIYKIPEFKFTLPSYF